MKNVADTLGVSRPHLIERLKGRSKPRGSYDKVEDAKLLPIIRGLVDQRPSYGYRRIAMLLNRERRAADQPVVEAKRVHRIMGKHAMLLKRTRPFARAAFTTVRSRSCARTCAGARMGWRSPARTARLFFSPSSLTPSTARSSPGRQSPMRAAPAQTCTTGCWRRSRSCRSNPSPTSHQASLKQRLGLHARETRLSA